MSLSGGIDLGGTKIQTVVVDDTHTVLGEARWVRERPDSMSTGIDQRFRRPYSPDRSGSAAPRTRVMLVFALAGGSLIFVGLVVVLFFVIVFGYYTYRAPTPPPTTVQTRLRALAIPATQAVRAERTRSAR